MGKFDKILSALQKQHKKMESMKSKGIDNTLLAESAAIVKKAASFKKQAALVDKQLKEMGEAELKSGKK